MPELD